MDSDGTTYDRLLHLASEPQTDESRREIDAIIQAHPAAADRLARIQSMLACLRSHHAVAPSATAMAEAVSIAANRRTRDANRPGWLERAGIALAELLFDSRVQPTLGLRGDEPGFQLTYQGDLADVDIDACPTEGGRWLLLGHISPREAILIDEVVVCPVGGEGWTPVELSDRGAFRIALSKARYELVIRSGERAMLIREIELA